MRWDPKTLIRMKPHWGGPDVGWMSNEGIGKKFRELRRSYEFFTRRKERGVRGRGGGRKALITLSVKMRG